MDYRQPLSQGESRLAVGKQRSHVAHTSFDAVAVAEDERFRRFASTLQLGPSRPSRTAAAPPRTQRVALHGGRVLLSARAVATPVARRVESHRDNEGIDQCPLLHAKRHQISSRIRKQRQKLKSEQTETCPERRRDCHVLRRDSRGRSSLQATQAWRRRKALGRRRPVGRLECVRSVVLDRVAPPCTAVPLL